MVGKRIRLLREQLGLSQRQLAGKEMTRNFISLVESGKCTPSPETLRVIAGRLGKPVEYFVSDAPSDEQVDLVIALASSAEESLNREEPGLHEAHRKVLQALKLCLGLGRPDLEARVRYLLIQCLRGLDRHDEIIDQAHMVLGCYHTLEDRQGMALTYGDLGASYYRRDDFPNATAAYEKAVLYAAGQKALQRFLAHALTVLGSSLFRMGVFDKAMQRFQEALQECAVLGSPEHYASAALGLGCVLYRTGNLASARTWTFKAVEQLKAGKKLEYYIALQNLAVIEGALGNSEQSYLMLQECLRVFGAMNRPEYQASVLEELARYWLHRGNRDKAEEMCWEALDLLEVRENSVLRGVLYRMLGQIHTQRHEYRHAVVLLRTSVEILRRLKATADLSQSMEELHRVREIAHRARQSAPTA